MCIFIHVIGALIALAIASAIVMWLWNKIIPGITGWQPVNYWKSLGLVVLFHLLTFTPSHSCLSCSDKGGHHAKPGMCQEQTDGKCCPDGARSQHHGPKQHPDAPKPADQRPGEN